MVDKKRMSSELSEIHSFGRIRLKSSSEKIFNLNWASFIICFIVIFQGFAIAKISRFFEKSTVVTDT